VGWWETDKGLVGDGPLDDVEDCLARVTEQYVEEHGRKPTLDELAACICAVVGERVDEFTSEDGIDVVALVPKTKRRPARRTLRPGDLFVVPLTDGTRVVGRLAPQYGAAEFFARRWRRTPRVGLLAQETRVQLESFVPMDAIERGHWKLIGHLPWAAGEYTFRPYLVGSKITSAEGPPDVFTDCSASLRSPVGDEWRGLPKLGIYNEAGVVDALERKIPVVQQADN
jgi:hypothetical protein